MQGAAYKQDGLPPSRASRVQPGSVSRAEGRVPTAGECKHKQDTEQGASFSGVTAGGHSHKSNGVCDEARGGHSGEVPSSGLRGLPLSTVVAAYSRGHAGGTTSEEERDAKVAGSRGSSQTRC